MAAYSRQRVTTLESYDCTRQAPGIHWNRSPRGGTDQGSIGWVFGVAFGSDSRRLVMSNNSSVEIWEARMHVRVAQIENREMSWAIAFSRDGRRLAGESQGHSVRLWKVEAGRGWLIATRSRSWAGRVELRASAFPWLADGPGMEMPRMSHNANLAFADFDAEGRFLATAGSDGTARVWDVASQGEVARIGHDVRAVAFSPDGLWLATGDASGMVSRRWPPNPYRIVGEAIMLSEPGVRTEFADFSSDGRWVATARDDRTARIFQVNTCA